MEIEIKDVSHGEADEGKTFDHHCVLAVKTTDEDGNVSETKEQGYMIQGKDLIYLKAPKIYPSQKEQPLLTEAQDIVGAINELFMLEPEGDDWQPPPWWIPVPEPEPYEIYILVWVTDANNEFRLYLQDPETESTGSASFFCDWGDGTTTQYPPEIYGYYGSSLDHKFVKLGQCLVKIVATSKFCLLQAHIGYARNCYFQIIKTGSSIILSSKIKDENHSYGTPFNEQPRLKYIKIKSKSELPLNKTNNYFSRSYALQKIERQNTKKASGDIPMRCFQENIALTESRLKSLVDCNSVTAVGDYGFYYCCSLKTITLPNCTYIGKNAFSSCYNLQKIIVAEGCHFDDYCFRDCYNLQEIVNVDSCTFGTGCFDGCWSLYPRPDGSVK